MSHPSANHREPGETPRYNVDVYKFWERHHFGSLDAAIVMMNELQRCRDGQQRGTIARARNRSEGKE